MSWSWRSLAVLVVVLAAACESGRDGAEDADRTTVVAATAVTGGTTASATATETVPAAGPTADAAGVRPEGFAAEAATITAADGTVCELCLWVAATAEQRSRGLMGVTDLAGADGMVFTWDAPTQVAFWMRDTPMPLSIAFFAHDGAFVSSADMVPCLDGPDEACARYPAAGPFTAAIEVPAGGLPAIGVASGSVLVLHGTPCDPAG